MILQYHPDGPAIIDTRASSTSIVQEQPSQGVGAQSLPPTGWGDDLWLLLVVALVCLVGGVLLYRLKKGYTK